MKKVNKLLSILLVLAMLFNNFMPLVVMAKEALSDDENIQTYSVSDLKAKGNIEIELHLALPIRNREETGINVSIKDKNSNEATVNLNNMADAKDGIYEENIKLGSDSDYQDIRTLVTRRDYNGHVLSGSVVSDNIVYYSINFYSLDVGTYTITFSGNNYANYSFDVTLGDFSKRVSLSDEAGMFAIGDINNDKKVDKDDEQLMISEIEKKGTNYDLNLDGVVDIADLNYITANMNMEKKQIKMEKTSAIINSENVSVDIPQSTKIEGDISDLFIDSTDGIQLSANDGANISAENPVQIAIDNTKAVEMSEIRIGVGATNTPTKMKLIVEDDKGEQFEYLVDENNKDIQDVHLFTDEVSEDTIRVDLEGQVAVKKVTIFITETSTNTLADIAKVEFLNNVKVKTQEPEGFYTPQYIHVDDTKSEQLTISFENVPNVTGYEIKITGGNMNGVVFQTTFNTFTIEDLKNYVTYNIEVQSTNQEWRSGWSDKHEGTPKATRKAPKVDMVNAVGGYGKIDFSWKAMDDTQFYKLYYRKAGDDVFTLIDEIKDSKYTVSGLEAGTEYEAYVIGVNEIGESDSYTLVSAQTKANGATIVPKYYLINDKVENGKTSHIKEVHYHTGTMTDDNKYSIVDDDYSTYWHYANWQISAYYGFNTGAPVIVLDKKYKMNEFVLTVPDQYAAKLKSGGQNSDDVQVHYWDIEHDVYDNDGRKAVRGTLVTKKDEMGRQYYLLKLAQPIEAVAVSFALTVESNVHDIKIDEVKFYNYDSLVDDVAALFTDDLRLELADGVNQETITKLKERANAKDHDEYSPYRESVLADLDYAEKILNDEAIADVITLNTNISNVYSNHAKFAMTINDYQPLGIAAKPKETLNVYVGTQAKDVNVELVFTQYHAEAGTWNKTYKLTKGLNTVEVPEIGSSKDERGGSVYIRYTSKPDLNNPIKVRVSGGTKIPVIDTTLMDNDASKKEAIQNYINELKEYNANLKSTYGDTFDKTKSVLGSTEIATKYGLFSVSSVAVEDAINSELNDINQKVDRLYESMEAFDEMMELFYRQKGFSDAEGTSDTDKMPKSRINIRYMQMFDGAFMYAGGFHVGIEYGSIAGLVQAKKNSDTSTGYFGWGISHEVGHQINIKDTAFAEVTNNIYALLAQTSNDRDESRLEPQYNKIYEKVTSHTKGRAQNVFVQLGMYWQLHLAYDENKTFEDTNSVFAKVNQIGRAYSNTTKKYSRDDLTILFASEAVGRDLTDYFAAWGLVASDELKSELSSLGYAKETRPIYYLNDKARRYKLNGGSGISEGANILTASIGEANSADKRVTINFDSTNRDAILGYEIKRNGVSVAFVENKDGVKSFTDNVGAENNRAYKYSVVAYDYLLHKSNEVLLDEVKISHNGSVKKDAFTITSNVKEPGEVVDYENEKLDDSKLSVNKLIDGKTDTGFKGTEKIKVANQPTGDGAFSVTTDNGNAYVIINLNNSMSVSGITYHALVENGVLDVNTIKKYKVSVSSDGEKWTVARTGTFGVTADNLEETIYFMGQDMDSEKQLWTYNDINYIKIESDGNKNGLSGAEIDVIAPPGDNVDIQGNSSIGVLKEDYCYQTDGCPTNKLDENGKVEGIIEKGSVVIQGSYRGDPGLNIILIGDAGDDKKNYSGYQLIFAELNSDNSVYYVADGTWLYVMTKEEYEAMLKSSSSIRAYLYRVNDAKTLEGQRLTSTSKEISGLKAYADLPEMTITK